MKIGLFGVTKGELKMNITLDGAVDWFAEMFSSIATIGGFLVFFGIWASIDPQVLNKESSDYIIWGVVVIIISAIAWVVRHERNK